MDHLTEEIPGLIPLPASLKKRCAAALIDLIISVLLMAGIGYISGDSQVDNDSGFSVTLHGASALIFIIAWIAAFPVVEGLTGQTIGKKLLQIKVCDKTGKKVSVGQSLLRHLFDTVDYFLLIGLIVAAANTNKQRIGDLVAGTIVTTI